MRSDHFGPVANAYATYRPSYPASLFVALAARAPSTRLAWDCGCGSGQASVALAQHFDAVVATDMSADQVAHATAHSRVTYHATPAQVSGLRDRSADLVTVAQALHWFDVDAFHAEVRRVLVPRGVIAEWSYGLLRLPSSDAVTGAIDDLDVTLRDWWPPERVHIDNSYRDLAFPFARLDVGEHMMRAAWTSAELLGFLGTWSAITRFRNASGSDPLADVRVRILEAWGDADRHTIEWPLTIRCGRMP